VVAVPFAVAQQSEEEQKSLFLRFVEDRLSTPERQIRISNLDGILSENVSIREITLADGEGVWLRIENAVLDWNQGALLGGRLEIRSLTAGSIDYMRQPVETAGGAAPPSPEAGGLDIPDFPVAIILDQLSVPSVTFGENVFGLGSEISIGGRFTLDDGSLDADLDITRLDGPGGTLSTNIAYAGENQTIDLGLTLTEPPDGIIANLLNIEGRPEIALTINGSGPIANLRSELTLDAGGQRALSGLATINQVTEGFMVDANLGGPIAELVAAPYRPFFGAQTTLRAQALLRDGGGLTISGIDLSGGQLALQGSAETTPDNFLRRLELTAQIADPQGGAVTLPVAGNATRVQNAAFTVSFGAEGSENWSARADVTGFETADLAARSLMLGASGIASNLDNPAERRVTFNGDGTLSGIVAQSPEVQAALGDNIGFGMAGLWNAGGPVELAELRLAGQALSVALIGQIQDWVFDGGVAVNTSSIAPFSGVAGRELSGALELSARGTISPLIGGFNLALDGTGSNLSVDDEALDRLLAGTVALSGAVARTETGFTADQFRIANDQVTILANGGFSSTEANFDFNLDLADLGLVSEQASGALSVVGTARGSDGVIALDLSGRVPQGELADRTLRDGALGVTGTLRDGGFSGAISGEGFLDGLRVALTGDLLANEMTRQLSALRFEAGGARLSGDLAQSQAGLIEGQLRLEAADISTAAALLLTQARGAINADITLSGADGEQNAQVAGTLRNVSVNDITVGSAEVTAAIADLFGVPQIDGTLEGANIRAAGVTIGTLSAQASRNGEATAFSGRAALDNGAQISAAGSLSPLAAGYRLALDRADLTQGQLSARLAQPTALAINGDTVTLDAVRFDVGSGSVTATGTAGQTLDIALNVNALPLSIANAIQPGLGLAGTVDGSARITGSGSDPRASFQFTGSGINAAAIGEFGIAPLQFTANGSFADQTVTLAGLDARGNGGLQLTGSGTVPLSGGGLNLNIEGSAPLALGNRFVADRGGQLSGTVLLSARVSGSLADPSFGGTVSTNGAGYIDPELNLRLENITGRASLNGQQAVIEALSANLATGGSISGSGTIGLGNGLPANIALRLNSARYADGNLLVATVSGDLALSGPLAQSPLLSGTVLVEEANISVPETFGGAAELIDVDHRAIPPAAAATLARARIDERGGDTGAPPSVVRLDVNVNAPNQIFIRGRGLDAEVGGTVRLTGTVNDIVPVGGFSLNRGRLSILGQRVTFESGSVTLVGDLDPFLNLVARTEGDGITVFVTVSGRASEISVDFSSNPELPQDEVLSRLIFNRSMGELSPLQLARLAGAAAELAGGSNPSLVDSLRDATGFDDLDVVTDDEGNVAVQAGRYIQDNIYVGVQAGADGQSRVTVNLDITDDIRARASAGADGESSVGIFYERDY